MDSRHHDRGFAMPTWHVEHAFEEFKRLRPTIEAAASTNEATTRMRAIDTVLYEVLRWNKTIVEEEKYVRQEGFADYALMDGAAVSTILEAKKHGATFVLPGRVYQDRPVGFPLLDEECPDAEKALRQAQGYAAGEGARFIAITNGFQWILTLAYVQNQPLAERSVWVFESLDAIQKRFRSFWDCFSMEALFGNRPANLLLESRKAPAPPKLSQTIPTYPVPANRNTLVNQLSAVTALVLSEVRHDEDDIHFLKECYIEPELNQSSILQATELIEQRLSTDQRILAEAIDQQDVSRLIKTYIQEKPIIVLGKIGHGKSTFLKYLRLVKAKQSLDKYVQLTVDFVDRPATPTEVGNYIYGEIEDQLRERYETDIQRNNIVRGVLHNELDRFEDSPEGRLYPKGCPEYAREELVYINSIRHDKHRYLTKVFQHIRHGRGASVAVFLDNLDRRLDDIQEEAFLLASAMARDWESLVFVCLRPGTYYRSRRFGVLDSVAPKLIPVASPKSKLMVIRRLEYAKQVALGEADPKKSKTRAVFSSGVSFDLPTVGRFLDACVHSFVSNRNLSDLFDVVSNGNARDLLAKVSEFLTSQHLNTAKILEKSEKGHYLISEHEAVRALLFGDFMHYDPSRSTFINLFDIERADPMEHFSRFTTLHLLVAIPSGHPSYGYASTNSLIRHMCQIGFSEDHARSTVRYLFEKDYIESKTPSDEWDNSIENLRITSLGKYHIMTLVNQFGYMDAVVVDTPILDDSTRAVIQDRFNIVDRLERAKVFVEYLNRCAGTIQDAKVTDLWNVTFRNVKDDIRRVNQRATESGA